MLDRNLGRVPRRAVAIGTGLFAFFLLLLTGQRALDAYRVRQEVSVIRQEIAALRVRNISLQEELASAQLEEDIERTVRQELGLVRKGDHPLVLIWPDGNPPKQHIAQPSPAAEPTWRAWLRLFFDVGPSPL